MSLTRSVVHVAFVPLFLVVAGGVKLQSGQSRPPSETPSGRFTGFGDDHPKQNPITRQRSVTYTADCEVKTGMTSAKIAQSMIQAFNFGAYAFDDEGACAGNTPDHCARVILTFVDGVMSSISTGFKAYGSCAKLDGLHTKGAEFDWQKDAHAKQSRITTNLDLALNTAKSGVEIGSLLDEQIKEARTAYCRGAIADMGALLAEAQSVMQVFHGCFRPAPFYKNATWLAEGCNSAIWKAGLGGVTVGLAAYDLKDQFKKTQRGQLGLLARNPGKLLEGKLINSGYKLLSAASNAMNAWAQCQVGDETMKPQICTGAWFSAVGKLLQFTGAVKYSVDFCGADGVNYETDEAHELENDDDIKWARPLPTSHD